MEDAAKGESAPDKMIIFEPFPHYRMLAIAPGMLIVIGMIVTKHLADGWLVLCVIAVINLLDSIWRFIEQVGGGSGFRSNSAVKVASSSDGLGIGNKKALGSHIPKALSF